jgi:hypothetical protein
MSASSISSYLRATASSVAISRALNALGVSMGSAYESLSTDRQMMVLVSGVPVSGDHILGMLARGLGNADGAVAHYEEAIEFSTNAGYRPEIGWTSFDYAELLLERDAAHDDREKVT